MTCDTNAVQTNQSITVDVDSLSDGGRNGIEQSSGVRHTDDISLQVWHKYSYTIYIGWESSRYELWGNRGRGGGERQRLYAAE